MVSSMVLIRKLKEEKWAQYWDTDEQDWAKTLNIRKIGLFTCSAGRAPKPSLQTPWTVLNLSPRQGLRHQDLVSSGSWASQLCAGQTSSPRALFACPAVPWAVTPPQHCRLSGALAPGAFLTAAGKLQHICSSGSHFPCQHKQNFNSTGGTGQECQAGDTAPLPAEELSPYCQGSKDREAQGRALSLLLVSWTVLRLKSQSHNCLTCS